MVVFATLTITPLLWLVIACILAEPHLQSALLHLYVDGSDAVLWHTLRQLLTIVAVIELADALQTVLGGVVQVTWPPHSILHVLSKGNFLPCIHGCCFMPKPYWAAVAWSNSLCSSNLCVGSLPKLVHCTPLVS